MYIFEGDKPSSFATLSFEDDELSNKIQVGLD